MASRLAEIVGEDYVTADRSVTIAYGRDQAVKSEGPDVVVLPRSTEQVAAVLRTCNELGVPVIPKGTGANMGGLVIPEPGVGGVVLDLKRMNRILELDPVNKCATVECGVSYGQLQVEAYNRGLYIVVPSGPHSVKVTANVLGTRGIGHYAGKYGLGDNLLLGYEWVTPSGDVLRFGCWAHPGAGPPESGEALPLESPLPISSPGLRKHPADLGKVPAWPHGPGPDLSGIFLETFGSTGVVTKARVKLFPKKETLRPGSPMRVAVVGGPIELLFDCAAELIKAGISNLLMMKWPYISVLLPRSREQSFQFLNMEIFPGLIIAFLEGSERKVEYHKQRIEEIARSVDKRLLVGEFHKILKDFFPMVTRGEVTESDREFGFYTHPRKLHDFMFESVRILRLHGAFMPHCPFFSVEAAKQTWLRTRDFISEEIGRPAKETCCYFQNIEDGHWSMQEMDVEFNPNDPLDALNAVASISGPIYETTIKRRDGIFYYLYHDTDAMEAFGPVLFPGYFSVLKQLKREFDPNGIMNRGKGLEVRAPAGVARGKPEKPKREAGPRTNKIPMYFFIALHGLGDVLHEALPTDPAVRERRASWIDGVKNGSLPPDEFAQKLEGLLVRGLMALRDSATAHERTHLVEMFRQCDGLKVRLSANYRPPIVLSVNGPGTERGGAEGSLSLEVALDGDPEGLPGFRTDEKFDAALVGASHDEPAFLVAMMRGRPGLVVLENLNEWTARGPSVASQPSLTPMSAFTRLFLAVVSIFNLHREAGGVKRT
ncbi:MAG: hypothetical protein Kow0069_35060 [Promethearchaeota archaeon]